MGHKTSSIKVVPKNYNFTQKLHLQSRANQGDVPIKSKYHPSKVLKQVYSSKGHSSRAVYTIISSWRDYALESYNTYVQLWVTFNNDQLVLDPKPFEVTDFYNACLILELNILSVTLQGLHHLLPLLMGREQLGNEEVVRFIKGLLQKDPHSLLFQDLGP